MIDHVVRRDGLRRTPVMVLDSAQCVRTARSGAMRDEYARINELMMTVRSPAEKHGMVVVIASEANRSSFRSRNDQDNSTGLASGKGSLSLEYKADTPMTLRKTKAKDWSTVIRAKLEKNREGQDEPEWTMAWDGRGFAEVDVVMPTPMDHAQRVAQVISAGKGTITSTREAVRGVRQGRHHEARANRPGPRALKQSGRVTGGNKGPLEVVSAIDMVT